MAVNGDGVPSDTALPGHNSPRTFNVGGFRISAQKLPILKAGPIEDMTKKLGIAPPEMIFGDNFVAIEHPASKWGIKFDAFGALDRVDKTGEKMLKVAYSKEWHQSREDSHNIKEVVKPFDWSYTTDYKGEQSPDGPQFQRSDMPIPLDLLKRPDPIQFFDEVVLYEDELADNGIAMLSVKIRVMPTVLLLLCRFFMRLDNVLLRVRDTRIYVDWGKKLVIREYLAKERDYEHVRQQFASQHEDPTVGLRNPNLVAAMLPVVEKTLEQVDIST